MTWLSAIVVTTVLCVLIWGLRMGVVTTLLLFAAATLVTTIYFAVTAVF
jgi:hypothetical protein